MTATRRRKLKPGTRLPMQPALPFIEADPELRNIDARLIRSGYVRTQNVAMYLQKNSTVSLRFVWRKRFERRTMVHTVNIKVRME
ncbi:MAG: hypothetical protein WD407_08755 [Rhodospirillales bacterium]